MPKVFCPWKTALVVSDDVKTRLEHLPGVTFEKVVFCRLVDLALPIVGDLAIPTPLDLNVSRSQFLNEFPDVGDFHLTIGPYWLLVCPTMRELLKSSSEVVTYRQTFSRYQSSTSSIDRINICEALLDDFAVIGSYGLQMSDDAFSILAPYLDPDYFSFDYISTHPRIDPFTGKVKGLGDFFE
ncbi:MAG: hypothetical protein ACK526_07090 [Planctomyces sp.]